MARRCLWGLLYAVVTAFALHCSAGWFLGWYSNLPG